MGTEGMVQLAEKIRTRSARVGIVGLGYVGLPEAVIFAQAGFRVSGFGVNAERVALINAGKSLREAVCTLSRTPAESLSGESDHQARDTAKPPG